MAKGYEYEIHTEGAENQIVVNQINDNNSSHRVYVGKPSTSKSIEILKQEAIKGVKMGYFLTELEIIMVDNMKLNGTYAKIVKDEKDKEEDEEDNVKETDTKLASRKLQTSSKTQDEEIKINGNPVFDPNAVNNMPNTVVNDKDAILKEQDKLKNNIVENNKLEMEKTENANTKDEDVDDPKLEAPVFGDMTPIYNSTTGKTDQDFISGEPLAPVEEDSLFEEVKDSSYGSYTGGGEDDIYSETNNQQYDTTSIISTNNDTTTSTNTTNTNTTNTNTGTSGTKKYNTTDAVGFSLKPGTTNVFISKRTKMEFTCFTKDEYPKFFRWLKSQAYTRNIKEIQEHCTAGTNKNWKTTNDYNQQMNAMIAWETDHTNPEIWVDDPKGTIDSKTGKVKKVNKGGRGWSAIAQHFSTFPDGGIACGIPLKQIPTGIKGRNSIGICIENKGGGMLGDERFGALQLEAILTLTAALCIRCNLDPDATNNDTSFSRDKPPQGGGSIIYHCWFAQKSCPGYYFGLTDDEISIVGKDGNTREACKKYFIPKVKRKILSIASAYKNA